MSDVAEKQLLEMRIALNAKHSSAEHFDMLVYRSYSTPVLFPNIFTNRRGRHGGMRRVVELHRHDCDVVKGAAAKR
jgi:hypothetical protein